MASLVEAPDWYKEAIIYELHLKAFFDANNDGIGDLPGLIAKLDYLQDLGITAIWLLPFYPSPLRDDGYDIADYRNIHQSYGKLRDFRQLVREAHERGMRVIIELVVNHTSDQHPWFKRARTAKPGTKMRDFYVWSDNDEKYKGTRIIFTDTEKSNWTWDPVASAFYWHRFFSHQPDLNFDNPMVVRAVLNTMRFWLDMGVDGLRLDAIPYLVEREGTGNENLPETHAVIKQIRAEIDRLYPDRMLLGEANQWPEDVKDYFGTGDECHMAFHFPLMPRMYMAIAREDRHPITDIMRQTPEIPDTCQWAIFLRNHDELTLEMVTDSERDYLWSTYAADKRARLNLGIRRRLAPLMENDRRKIELMNSLLLSMPGTPIIYYGDEIGMGDNIYLGDRDGVRTPMQWTPDRNGGFSRADPASLFLPPIMDPVYGYEAVNVEAQSRSLSSLLNWMKRLINVRQSLKVFGRGSLTFLYPSNRAVIVYLRDHENCTVLCVMNLSRSAQAVELELPAFVGRVPVELLGQTAFPPITETSYMITLQGYGFYWFQLTAPAESKRPAILLAPDLVTLVQGTAFASLFESRNRHTLERDILPPYMKVRRWFAQKSLRDLHTVIVSAACYSLGDREWCWTTVEARGGESSACYSLPLTAEWQAAMPSPAAAVIAKLRHGPREGYLVDALLHETFVRLAIEAVIEGREVATTAGILSFTPSPAMRNAARPEKFVIRLSEQEQSNSSAVVDEFLMIKFYRRVAAGPQPEIEMGGFLTTQAQFANTPAMLGSIHLTDAAGNETALAVLHALIRNQGDAWSFTLAYLDRFLHESRIAPVVEAAASSDAHTTYRAQIVRLALRTAELHRALYVETGDPSFVIERATPEMVRNWGKSTAKQLSEALAQTERVRAKLPEDVATVLADLIAREQEIGAYIHGLAQSPEDILLSRYHGDYHLGQVLIVQNDVYIVDFEGAPQLPLEQRRGKHSIIRDVAGMLRSFDYAAWSALDRATAIQPDRRNELLQAVLLWREDMSRSFLEAYTGAMADCPLWPQDQDLARRLLALFLIEKAAMEIIYEIGNRPERIAVPIKGVQALLPHLQPAEGSYAGG